MTHSNAKTRLLPLVTIMVIVTMAVTVLSLWMIYRATIATSYERLVDLGRTQARLIHALVQLEVEDAIPSMAQETADATLAQVVAALENQPGFGKTGEFVLGRRTGTCQ